MVRTNTIAENRSRRIDAEPDPEIPTGIGELGIGSGMVQTYHQTQRIARDRGRRDDAFPIGMALAKARDDLAKKVNLADADAVEPDAGSLA